MQQSKDFEPLPPDAIDKDEWRVADNQLTCSLHATDPTHQRVICQHTRLPLDLLIKSDGGGGIVLGNIVQLLEAIASRCIKPQNRQLAIFSDAAAACHAARLLALCRFTSS